MTDRPMRLASSWVALEVYYLLQGHPDFNLASNRESDFVIFGNKKLSIGTIDPLTGVVNGARVRTDPESVRVGIRDFETLKGISKALSEPHSEVRGGE